MHETLLNESRLRKGRLLSSETSHAKQLALAAKEKDELTKKLESLKKMHEALLNDSEAQKVRITSSEASHAKQMSLALKELLEKLAIAEKAKSDSELRSLTFMNNLSERTAELTSLHERLKLQDMELERLRSLQHLPDSTDSNNVTRNSLNRQWSYKDTKRRTNSYCCSIM
ncbi:unnamed protein product [Phytomonas sp. Hart1]|nr:unnamed protein product [Phytomonas sp. Hart1]|eukprot:CCW71461.1 unnamed protein product [Phytomonas sp. isolate Hart1]